MKGSVKWEGNSWYYVVTLGKKPNGKPNQIKKRGFKSQKEAQKALNEVIYEFQKGIYVQPSQMKYEELLDKWLENKKRTIQNSTFISYDVLVNTHIIPALGTVPLSRIKPLTINEFYNNLYTKAKLSGTTVQKVHMIIKDSLKYAVRMELIAKNPADAIDRPKREYREVEVWTIEEVKKFLSISKNDPLYIAYHLALTTGMRQGEILGLRWKDIDFKKKLLMIRQTRKIDGELKAGAKSKSGLRVIPITKETIDELKEHRKHQIQLKKEVGTMYQDFDLVVATMIGTPINPSNLRRSFSRNISQAGIKKIRFHDLRHYVELFIMGSIKKINSVTGVHSKITPHNLSI